MSSSKQPPLHIVKQFLDRFGIQEGTFRQVRCDQGGELAKSSKFREVIQSAGYSIEPTGSDNSSQNGVAERPNRTFGDMMRSMLLNAGLPPQYWSYALIQAVFIKNRLPHAHHQFKKTPFEAITGRKPNVKDIKIFGSRVIAKNTGTRRAKLDDHTSRGIFLHHTGTTAISKYLDTTTNREKTTSHLEYDEAHYTVQDKPLGALALINQGYNSRTTTDTVADFTSDNNAVPTSLHVQKLSPQAKLPTRSTDGAAGLDIFSAEPCTIKPGEIKLVKTDIAIACPDGTYGRIAPRSGLTIKQQLDVRAGVIDSDYRGNIQVAMHNIGQHDQQLPAGTKIAQLILERISNVNIVETETLPSTRGSQGFGSTDTNTTHEIAQPPISSDAPVITSPSDKPSPTVTPVPYTDVNIVECDPNEIITPSINAFSSPLEDLYLSCDPFGPTTTTEIKITGVHPTLGLELEHQSHNGRMILRNCTKGTPAHKIKKWRSTLRDGNLLRMDNKPVSSPEKVKKIVQEARLQNKSTITLTLATEERIPVHIDSGTPQIFFDQLNALAAYLQEIKFDETFLDDDLETPLLNLLKVKKKAKGMAQFSRK